MLFSFLFSILATLGLFGQPAMDSDPAPCAPVLLEEGVDYTSLMQQGWFSLAGDGMEALYAPGC